VAAPGEEDGVAKEKKAWEPMKLAYAGDVGDVLKNAGGQGKTNPTTGDPGDIRKPPGQS